MVISVRTFEQVALEDNDAHWELAGGVLRQKPGMTARHNQIMNVLGIWLGAQLLQRGYVIRVDSVYLRAPGGSVYRPDLAVIPRNLFDRMEAAAPRALEVYTEPLPLVVEVWSPSTGDYDVEVKLREYQQRGDLEIWRLHPIERTLRAWRRQADGSYTETLYTAGVIEPIALPCVRIVLAELFN